ncbi:MAG: hypothetical protein FGM63_04685 [Candidatus Nanopelagicaceae bacterium]|nr:hypothetical protein [Candidatus Nanopelagicaceae bacterium]
MKNSSVLASADERSLQRGSVESGLVLIPTTLFFLAALQLLLAGSWQTIERARLHDFVIESSIQEALSNDSHSPFMVNQMELSKLENGSFEKSLNRSSNESTSLDVQERFTPFGTIRTFEMTTSLPIIGGFLQALDGGLFQVKNYAVSIIS